MPDIPSLAQRTCAQAAHMLFDFSLEHISVKRESGTLYEVHHNGCVYHATLHYIGPRELCVTFTSFPSHAKQSIVRIRQQFT
jgi:hypothetical protein